MNMLNFMETIPNSVKALLLVAFVSIGIGMFGKDFIDNKSVLSPSQSEQKNKDTAEEITVRLLIRNEKTKAAIPDVTVEFDRLGVPTPVGYTDSAGYIDIKIPKTEYVKIYLSKAGLQGKNFQIPIDVKDRNLTYYMAEVSSPSPNIKEVFPSPSVQKEFSSSLSQQENQNPKSEPVKIDNSFSQQAKGFQFDLQNCSQNDEGIICRLKITSLDKDTTLIMGGASANYPTRIIDDSGNEYIAKGSQIGSKKGIFSISSELIKNIPTNASINFTEIPSQINKIAVLQISFSGQEPNKPFKIQYNNIPVSK